MEANKTQALSGPPRLIPSLLAGFNSIAGHVRLIILPVIVDLFLWFGPHLNIQTLFGPVINEYIRLFSESGSTEIQTIINSSKELWQETLSHFNLFTSFRTFPIGVPSLLAGRGVVSNPFGSPASFDLSSSIILVFSWLVIILIGLCAGAFFFSEVARITINPLENFSLARFLKKLRNTLYLTFSAYTLLLLLAIPVALLIVFVSLISPSLTQIAIIFVSLILIWLLLPLIFSSHGIYCFEQNVFASAINSIRLVRYFLPGTGIFLLIGVLISQGLDILWTFPPENSWLVLVGILGHAFIATSLIASSFIYYKGGVQWMNEKMQRFATKPKATLEQQ